jgi:hypothetical protein
MTTEAYKEIAAILKREGIDEIGFIIKDSVTKGLLDGVLENRFGLQIRIIEIGGVKFTLTKRERLNNILTEYQKLKQ